MSPLTGKPKMVRQDSRMLGADDRAVTRVSEPIPFFGLPPEVAILMDTTSKLINL